MRISTRQREILILVAEGLSDKGIGRQLGMSERTVESHLANAYIKLDVSSKFDLVRRAAS